MRAWARFRLIALLLSVPFGIGGALAQDAGSSTVARSSACAASVRTLPRNALPTSRTGFARWRVIRPAEPKVVPPDKWQWPPPATT
jgi:hypothetical protein